MFGKDKENGHSGICECNDCICIENEIESQADQKTFNEELIKFMMAEFCYDRQTIIDILLESTEEEIELHMIEANLI